MPINLFNQDKRATIFPIARPEIWKLYKTGAAQTWFAEEIKFKSDASQYKNALTPEERRIIEVINGFFSQSDQLIENCVSNDFSPAFSPIPEIGFYYTYKAFNENVHVETYNRQIIETIIDAETQSRVLNAIHKMPAVTKVTNWITENLGSDKPLAHRMSSSICTEGILFSAQFAIIYWFRSRGLLMGTAQANEFISRDENLHAVGDIVIMKNTGIIRDISKDAVSAIFMSAVSAATEFVEEMMTLNGTKFDLRGLTRRMCIQYIQYVADSYYGQLYPGEKIYGEKCPFQFMEQLNYSTMANFFEQDSTEYNMSNNETNEEIQEYDEF